MTLKRQMNYDRLLNLWAKGLSSTAISRKMKRKSGQSYHYQSIESVVRKARIAGDTRAIYHRGHQ